MKMFRRFPKAGTGVSRLQVNACLHWLGMCGE